MTVPTPILRVIRLINHPEDEHRVVGFECRELTRGDNAFLLKEGQVNKAIPPEINERFASIDAFYVFTEDEETIEEYGVRPPANYVANDPVRSWERDAVDVQ